jgi:hypothetical protein
MYLTQQLQLPGYDISAEILSEDKSMLSMAESQKSNIWHVHIRMTLVPWHRHPSLNGHSSFPKILHGHPPWRCHGQYLTTLDKIKCFSSS